MGLIKPLEPAASLKENDCALFQLDGKWLCWTVPALWNQQDPDYENSAGEMTRVLQQDTFYRFKRQIVLAKKKSKLGQLVSMDSYLGD